MALVSVMRRLYRGETNINFIGYRRRWYLVSLLLIALCVVSFAVRGFEIGIEFKGGTQFQIQAEGTSITPARAERAIADAGAEAAEAAQEVGSGSTRSIIVKTAELDLGTQRQVTEGLAAALDVTVDKISVDSVGSDWGSEVTRKAVTSLIVFLIVVFLYIWMRFTWRMSTAAVVALLHDLFISAGIYSLVGFEVTPSTVVGLLTILGFSLYDTVVVFDKVAENSRNLTAGSRMTYSEAANLAVNQTLMRSVNTSLISLLPVSGLLFIGAGVLGVGTIKDLALILFVGLAVGAYSSLFLAAPLLCELTERQPEYKDLTRRVIAKRAAEARAREAAGEAPLVTSGVPARRGGGPAPAPRPGARPERTHPRPGGSNRRRRS